MKLTHLQAFFPESRHADVEALYRRFAADNGYDVVAFAAHLNKQGLLASDTLRDVLTLGEVSLSSPPDSESVPAHLVPRHKLLSELGHGAMGAVYLGRDADLNRTVAVKRLKTELAYEEGPRRRFFTEAQITAQLDHPNIVPIYGLETDEKGRLAYSMKIVRGKTFGELFDEVREIYQRGEEPGETLDLKSRLALMLPVCAAVAYAHRRGVLHRDLKPENIMVGAFHQVLVMDWGIARPIGDRVRVTAGPAPQKTRTGAVIGTPAYMSPEQARGETEGLDERSDVCALGLILFELVSLRRAMRADNPLETVLMAAEGKRAPLKSGYPKLKIPNEVRAIIGKATALDPDARYASADALADDIRRFLRDEAVHAAPDSLLTRVGRWISHHRATTLAIVFGLVLTMVAVAAVLMISNAAALDAQRRAAQLREQQLGNLGSRVTAQAHRMDTRLREYEALATGLATVAEYALTRPATPAKQYFTSDFTTAGQGPPDLAASTVYQSPMSLDFADFVAAPGVDRQAIAPRLNQLSELREMLERTQIRSFDRAAIGKDRPAIRELLLETGVPFIWTYIATEEGVLTGFPGLGEYPENYDPRDRPWYQRSKQLRGPKWGAAEADESGMGLLITCSVGLRDAKDAFLGVAAVDLTFAYVIDTLLDPPGLSGAGEAFLVDGDGAVVVRSSQKDSARDHETYEQPRFSFPAVEKAFEGGPETGHVVFDHQGRPHLALWSRLEAVDWTYVVIGDEPALLTAASTRAEAGP